MANEVEDGFWSMGDSFPGESVGSGISLFMLLGDWWYEDGSKTSGMEKQQGVTEELCIRVFSSFMGILPKKRKKEKV